MTATLEEAIPQITDRAQIRVLVTGSRTWRDPRPLMDALGFYWELNGMLTVVHGDCPDGADAMARAWCERLNGGVMGQVAIEERHPADWARHGRLKAGFIRNTEMVELGADVCLAYVDRCHKQTATCLRRAVHGSHGAMDCSTKAIQAGIPTKRWRTWST